MSRRHVEERGWWSRNWGWCCPLSGCLGCVGLIAVLIAFAVGSAFMMVRGSEVDELAMEIASTHPAVIDALGEPIERGWGFEGRFHRSTTGGSVDIRFTIRGPDGEGTLRVKGEREDEEWILERLDFRREGSTEWIDLLESDAATAEKESLNVRVLPGILPAGGEDAQRRSSR